jgi:methylase of polypeptide subunit release factors
MVVEVSKPKLPHQLPDRLSRFLQKEAAAFESRHQRRQQQLAEFSSAVGALGPAAVDSTVGSTAAVGSAVGGVEVPVAYLTGLTRFCGRPFTVDASVMIPRTASETIVQTAVQMVLGLLEKRHEHRRRCGSSSNNNYNFRICDLGTGSGCLLISCLLELEDRLRVISIKNDGGAEGGRRAGKEATEAGGAVGGAARGASVASDVVAPPMVWENRGAEDERRGISVMLEGVGMDISEAALEVARKNAQKLVQEVLAPLPSQHAMDATRSKGNVQGEEDGESEGGTHDSHEWVKAQVAQPRFYKCAFDDLPTTAVIATDGSAGTGDDRGGVDESGFGVIVCNPPYRSSRCSGKGRGKAVTSPSGQSGGKAGQPAATHRHLDQEVVQHEPSLALFADDTDGLSAYRQIATALATTRANPNTLAGAPVRMSEDGFLVLEIGSGMHQAVSAIFEQVGMEVANVAHDSRGMARCLVLCWS